MSMQKKETVFLIAAALIVSGFLGYRAYVASETTEVLISPETAKAEAAGQPADPAVKRNLSPELMERLAALDRLKQEKRVWAVRGEDPGTATETFLRRKGNMFELGFRQHSAGRITILAKRDGEIVRSELCGTERKMLRENGHTVIAGYIVASAEAQLNGTEPPPVPLSGEHSRVNQNRGQRRRSNRAFGE